MMSRKGVTPLVGTALLILIAVSAVTSAAVFIQDTTEQVAGTVEDRLEEDELRDNSGIDIEFAYPNEEEKVSLVVRNTGRYTLFIEEDGNQLWNLYSDGRPVEYSYPEGDVDEMMIDPDSTRTLETEVDFPEGDYVTIDLEGAYGTSSSIICDNTLEDGTC